jgi:23S rRNA (cytidine1920-2'-O)/16S rRNA (cytidine1409-2'-O)-methyltransferase
MWDDSVTRLDVWLVEHGLAPTRSKAQALIEAGKVSVDNQVIVKVSHKVVDESLVEVTELDHPWVSRGGLKLAGALDRFSIIISEKICMDVGASTGGFTDVLLHHGAAKVYAVDVGHGQLHEKLRADTRVVNLEKTNARTLDATMITDALDIIVCDASFISLKQVLPAAMALAKQGAQLVALIKPQFEAGREHVGKQGVVKDAALHQQICDDITRWFAHDRGWQVRGLVESPITGPSGNREFLIWASYD